MSGREVIEAISDALHFAATNYPGGERFKAWGIRNGGLSIEAHDGSHFTVLAYKQGDETALPIVRGAQALLLLHSKAMPFHAYNGGSTIEYVVDKKLIEDLRTIVDTLKAMGLVPLDAPS